MVELCWWAAVLLSLTSATNAFQQVELVNKTQFPDYALSKYLLDNYPRNSLKITILGNQLSAKYLFWGKEITIKLPFYCIA